jgi:subtilisin family serine protease
MIRFRLHATKRPDYHPGMLIVKLRPSARPALAAAMTRRVSSVDAPGMATLAVVERAGRIKRVVPMSAPARERETRRTAMGVFAHFQPAVEDERPTDHNADVHLVEFEHPTDVPDVQVALGGDPHVEFVSQVPVRYLALPARTRKAAATTVNPPASLWNLAKIRWAEARSRQGFKDATNLHVAVLDTGIDVHHPDLVGRPTNYVFEQPDLPAASSDRDLVGHGTHVSGTISAVINNQLGINGICDCDLSMWKIFTDEAEYVPQLGYFTYFVDPVMYQRALSDCIKRGDVSVVNLSIGGPGKPDPQEQYLFKTLMAKGTTVVAAMGNEREDGSPTSYPAAIPGVIAVGATSLDDSITDFSNRGNHISLSAPGKAIWSTLPTYPGQDGFRAVIDPNGDAVQGKPLRRKTGYDAWDGTSMATPHVTAAAALLIAKRGKTKPADVRAALMASADKVPGMGGKPFDSDFGAGRLNLRTLLG